MWVTKQLMFLVYFHSIFSLQWKSMATSCLVTNIIVFNRRKFGKLLMTELACFGRTSALKQLYVVMFSIFEFNSQ